MPSSTILSTKPVKKKYKSLQKLPGVCIAADCPLLVERAAVIQNRETKETFLQLKMLNRGANAVVSAAVTGVLCSAQRQPVVGSEFTAAFAAANAAQGQAFGTRDLVPVYIVPAYVSITEAAVTYADGTTARWTGAPDNGYANLRPYVVPSAYRKFVPGAEDIAAIPYRFSADTYLCSCGTVVYGVTCPRCRRTFTEAMQLTTLPGLETVRSNYGRGGQDFVAQSDAEAPKPINWKGYSEKATEAGEAATDAAKKYGAIAMEASKKAAQTTQTAAKEVLLPKAKVLGADMKDRARKLLAELKTSPKTVPYLGVVFVFLVVNHIFRGMENRVSLTGLLALAAANSYVSDSFIRVLLRPLTVCLAMLLGPLVGTLYGAVSPVAYSIPNTGTYSPTKIVCGIVIGLAAGWLARLLKIGERGIQRNNLQKVAITAAVTALITTVTDEYLYVALGNVVSGVTSYGIIGFLRMMNENFAVDCITTRALLQKHFVFSFLWTVMLAIVLYFAVMAIVVRLAKAAPTPADLQAKARKQKALAPAEKQAKAATAPNTQKEETEENFSAQM